MSGIFIRNIKIIDFLVPQREEKQIIISTEWYKKNIVRENIAKTVSSYLHYFEVSREFL